MRTLSKIIKDHQQVLNKFDTVWRRQAASERVLRPYNKVQTLTIRAP